MPDILKKAILLGAKIMAALIGAALVAWRAVPYAYQVRGYEAIGGEWLLIIATFTFLLWLFCHDYKNRKFRKEQNKTCLDVTVAVE